jgi:poly(hydroxyalkanoate) depolymerase family esterase
MGVLLARLGRTISNLSRYRRAWDAATGAAQSPEQTGARNRLHEVAGFGTNPGNLRMLEYVPNAVGAEPALVVVLHGCTQSAAAYDHGSGWSSLADRHGFALLFPEQKRENNPKNCFTWFERGDMARGRVEAVSIREMIEHMVAVRRIARHRIFITGLSAGGAMASVMLATHPKIFAAGAIIAGLPYGAAGSVQEAFEAMFKGRRWPARHWGDLVRAASSHRGPWPRISVWHGSADTTVVPMNADEIVKQWADVHGLPASPTERTTESGFARAVWRDRDGREVIESVTIPGMAHGTPLASGEGEERCGHAGPFLLEVGVSSSYHIARFFGLLGARAATRVGTVVRAASAEPARAIDLRPGDILLPGHGEPQIEQVGRADPRHPVDVEAVITKALRAAGLMRP